MGVKQKSLRRFAALAVLVVSAGTWVSLSGAAARVHRGAYLYVVGGSVHAQNGQLSGSVVIRNGGTRAAGSSRVTLSIVTGRGVGITYSWRLGSLRRSAVATINVSVALPHRLPSRRLPLVACAAATLGQRASLPRGRCLTVGALHTGSSSTTTTTTTTTTTAPTTTTTPTGGNTNGTAWSTQVTTLTEPTSQAPISPVPFTANTPLELGDRTNEDYFAMVPPSYNPATPQRLLVWLHGCSDAPQNDTYWMAPTFTGYPQFDRPWIAISVGNAEAGNSDACWDTSPGCGDCQKVMNAIYNAETHFNIDRRRIVIAGYSSGGDMAYRLAFDRSKVFAGLLAENTTPFRDTGSTAAQSLAAASWHFPIIQLAHRQDDVYPLATVQSETGQTAAAGFPVKLLTADGQHYDANTEDDFTSLVYLGQPQWLSWVSP